jgi:hypothetical protein
MDAPPEVVENPETPDPQRLANRILRLAIEKVWRDHRGNEQDPLPTRRYAGHDESHVSVDRAGAQAKRETTICSEVYLVAGSPKEFDGLLNALNEAGLSDGPKVLRQPRAGAAAPPSVDRAGKLLAHHLAGPVSRVDLQERWNLSGPLENDECQQVDCEKEFKIDAVQVKGRCRLLLLTRNFLTFDQRLRARGETADARLPSGKVKEDLQRWMNLEQGCAPDPSNPAGRAKRARRRDSEC